MSTTATQLFRHMTDVSVIADVYVEGKRQFPIRTPILLADGTYLSVQQSAAHFSTHDTYEVMFFKEMNDTPEAQKFVSREEVVTMIDQHGGFFQPDVAIH